MVASLFTLLAVFLSVREISKHLMNYRQACHSVRSHAPSARHPKFCCWATLPPRSLQCTVRRCCRGPWWLAVCPGACGGVLCSARFGALQTDRDMLQPMLQRHVIRVLWMVPIYSLDACLSLTMPTRFEAYSEAVRELYEVRNHLLGRCADSSHTLCTELSWRCARRASLLAKCVPGVHGLVLHGVPHHVPRR